MPTPGSPAERGAEHTGTAGVGDHGLDPRPGGDLGRRQLGRHPAAAHRAPGPPARRSSWWSISTTSSINDAAASRRGSAVNRPGASVSSTRRWAPTRWATSAASRSLSPKRISSSATASFSLTMGTTPRVDEVAQRAARVQVLRAVDEVEGCQQDLPGEQAVRLEAVLPQAHEAVLAHGRDRLEDGRVGGPLLAAVERGPPGRDGAGCDHHDGVTRRPGPPPALRRAGTPSPRSPRTTQP